MNKPVIIRKTTLNDVHDHQIHKIRCNHYQYAKTLLHNEKPLLHRDKKKKTQKAHR